MSENFDITAEINRFLHPQKTLAPWIFDKNAKMLPDVRKGLMAIANKIVRETIDAVEGLVLVDVCLTGSSSGYLYKDDSDIDIRIEVHNNSCKEISSENQEFDTFLSLQKMAIAPKKHRFYFQGRYVDVKMSSGQIDFLSLYSIKNDCWRIEPIRDYAKNLSVESVLEYYLKKKEETLREFEQIKARNKGNDIAFGLEARDFYTNTLMTTAVNSNLETIEDYFTYKLFHYEGVFQSISRASVNAFNKGFSQRKEEI